MPAVLPRPDERRQRWLEPADPRGGRLRGLYQALGVCLHVPPAFAYVHLRWEGAHHIPPGGPAVLAANHTSMMDGPMVLLPVFLARRGRLVRFMTSREQFEGAFRPYLRFFSAFPVDVGSPDLPAYREACATLAAGRLLGVFAEGRIARDGRMQPFQAGAAWIALSAGVPLVPVTINHTWERWPRQASFPRPGPVEVIFHPPIPCQEMRDRRLDPTAVEEVRARLEQAVRSRYAGPSESAPARAAR